MKDQEICRLAVDVERRICSIINDFEKTTGCIVNDVLIDCNYIKDEKKRYRTVSLEIVRDKEQLTDDGIDFGEYERGFYVSPFTEMA